MISYYTANIDNPWTNSDVEYYEKYGSQRDSVIYNSAYNLRITLVQENIYLCSIKNNGFYRNFYLFANNWSKFHFVFDIPQLEALKDRELQNSNIAKRCLPQLNCLRASMLSNDSSYKMNDYITFIDCCSVIIEVNANINEFLFPTSKVISNREITQKIALMEDIYKNCINQFNNLVNAFDRYDEKERKIRIRLIEDQERRKKIIKRSAVSLIRKIPYLFNIPFSI